MTVLVVAASRHGSTTGIARDIGDRLRTRGLDVDIAEPIDVSSLDRYDAVIIGSAIYAGNWLHEARTFVDTNTDGLSARQVWLFSSGPLDDNDREAIPAQKIHQLTSATGALGNHVFAGRLERSELNLAERLLAKIVHAPDGDFRDWDDVTRWADEIADALTTNDGQSRSRPTDE